MAVKKWSFILTDINYVPLGEITNASDRSLTLSLNKATDSLTFKVRLDHYLSPRLAEGIGYIKAYRDSKLMFYGPLVSVEESGDAQNSYLTVNAASSGWILSKRLIGLSASGGKNYSVATDRAVITEELIEEANALSETGVATSLSPNVAYPPAVQQYLGKPSASTAVVYQAPPYSNLMEKISELSVGSQGYDWQIVPIDNWRQSTGDTDGILMGRKIGYFFARPSIGVTRPDALFDYNGGVNNIASYSRNVSRDTQINTGYSFTSNGPDVPGYPTVTYKDNASEIKWRMMQEVVQTEIINQDLRQQVVTENVYFRKDPKVTITFQPHIDPQSTGRLPVFGEDYSLGDYVRARAVVAGSLRFDSYFRVWSVQFNIDANGTESTSITTVQDAS